MEPIPDTFVRFMLSLYGDTGRAWLDWLPDLLGACARRWDLTIGPPFANLSYHYVAPAVRADGSRVVVKACSPTGEFTQEAEALRLCAGHGMALLLAMDAESEIMLLERLEPGTSLRSLADDAQATHIAADVMRQLWRPAPAEHPFPTIADWDQGMARLRVRYHGGTGPFPTPLVAEAESLYAELSASAAPPVVLHGDLHHDNILAAQRAPWLAIDPKGLVGEPAYETGSWLRNWLPDLLAQPDPARILARRIDQFAEELGFERARVRGWALYQAVLSAWWSDEEEHQPSEDMLACAALLAGIPG